MVALGMLSLLNTTEVRWFFPGETPPEVQSWFERLGDPFVQPPRTDFYLPGTGTGLGIKHREGRLEFKFRWKNYGPIAFSLGIKGKVESWTKWGFKFPTSPRNWIPVRKARQILYFGVTGQGEVVPSTPGMIPMQGGGLEVTRVWLDGKFPWWTIGIEVVAPAGRQLDVLECIARFVFNRMDHGLRLEDSLSYTNFLRKTKGKLS
jgi:hypothetical protein